MTYTPLRTPRHEQLSVRGLKHRLTWWGPPSDAPIVLLHGFQDCGDTWQFLVDCLPDTWTLVAPDWRGFGGTEWAAGGYWFPDYLADLEELLDNVAPQGGARVISHSMGANVAALYSGIRPQRLKWLVNLEGIGLRKTQPAAAPEQYATWLDEIKQPLVDGRYRSVQQLAEVLMRRNPRLTADRAEFVACAWTRDAEDGVRLAFDPRHRFVNPVLYRREEAEACWARMQIPMLFLAGESSSHQERRVANFSDEYVHRVFRDAKIVVLPGLGHMMHHEDPHAVAAPIIDFAQAHP
ncbi:MAG TPA: alpha/beta hydrolase [Steroidobacteraceae bacterium]|nr:alpha/beta hydrolase [Steroidobacteraceae bacterium]